MSVSPVDHSLSPVTPSFDARTRANDARVTAIALLFISMAFFSLSYQLYGAATRSLVATAGFGLFGYVGGTFMGFVGVMTLVGSLTFAFRREHFSGLER